MDANECEKALVRAVDELNALEQAGLLEMIARIEGYQRMEEACEGVPDPDRKLFYARFRLRTAFEVRYRAFFTGWRDEDFVEYRNDDCREECCRERNAEASEEKEALWRFFNRYEHLQL